MQFGAYERMLKAILTISDIKQLVTESVHILDTIIVGRHLPSSS